MEDEISYKIIGAAIEVHRTLGGPGLLESIYESSLCHELKIRGLQIQKHIVIPVTYKNTVVRDPLCLDIFVENKVIIEVKATENKHAIHQAQLLTYLRLYGYEAWTSHQFWPRVRERRHPQNCQPLMKFLCAFAPLFFLCVEF